MTIVIDVYNPKPFSGVEMEVEQTGFPHQTTLVRALGE